MYIENLSITSFASLSGLALDFGSSVNVITADNEAGKSTIAEFIKYIFYGFPSKSERERYLSFTSGMCAGSVILKDGNKRYRIERKTVSSKDTCDIYDLDTGSTVYAGQVPGEVFFGMPQGLFVSSAFVGQTDGNKINGKNTSELLDNLLFAADEGVNVKKALKKLDDDRVFLLHKNKKGGKIHELTSSITSLEGRFEKARDDSQNILVLENKIKEYSSKLEYEESNKKLLRGRIEDYNLKKHREKKARLDCLEEAYNNAVSAYNTHRSKYERNGFFPDQSYLENLKSCASEVVNCDERIAKVERRLENLNIEMKQDKDRRDAYEKEIMAKKAKTVTSRTLFLVAAVLCLVLSLVGVVGSAFMLITSNPTGIGLGMLTAVFFGGMILSFVFVSKYTAQIKEYESRMVQNDDGYSERLDVIREELTDRKNEKEKYLRALNDLSARWSIVYSKNALNEMVEVIEEAKRLESEQERARIAYAQMKTEAQEGMSDEPEDDGREINLPDDFNFKDTDRRLKLVEEMIRLKATDKNAFEIKLASLKAVSEDPSQIAEEIRAVQEEKNALDMRYKAGTLAYEKIEEASEKMRASVSPRLSFATAEKMSLLTDGKYDEIGVDSEFSMTFRAIAGEGRMTKGQDFMSAGTADAAYISLRLSLNELICAGKTLLPVIFDESFCRLDDIRLQRMMKLLVSQKNQSIIFTSNGREEEILKRMEAEFSSLKI